MGKEIEKRKLSYLLVITILFLLFYLFLSENQEIIKKAAYYISDRAYIFEYCFVCQDIFHEKFSIAFPMFFVAAYLLSAGFVFWYFKFIGLDKKKKREMLNYTILFAIAVIAILQLYLSFIRKIDHDEIHILHGSWYIANGHVIYRDFFYTYNPLFVYLMTIPFFLFGNSIAVIYFSRLFMWLLFLLTLYLIYRISEALYSRDIALYSVLFLSYAYFFLTTMVNVTPTSLQIPASLLSLYFLIKYYKRGNRNNLLYSGALIGISFLIIQKATLLFFAYFFIILLLSSRKRRALDLAYFGFPIIFLIASFLSYLILTNSLEQYIIGNLTELYLVIPFNLTVTIVMSLLQNLFFWILALAGFLYMLPDYRRHIFLLMPIIFSFAFIFLAKSPYPSYFAFPITLLAVGCALINERIISTKRKGLLSIYLLFLALSFLVVLGFELATTQVDNKQDIEMIQFVLENTSEEDYVYDDAQRFNIFRKDVDYVWLGKYASGITYEQLGFPRANLTKELIELRPKIVSDFGLTQEQKKYIRENYQKTGFEYITPYAFERIMMGSSDYSTLAKEKYGYNFTKKSTLYIRK